MRREDLSCSQLWIWLVTGIILFGCSGKPSTREKTNSQDLTMRTFDLSDMDEKALDPGHFQGKIVFLNLWATWCRPCIEEIPSIERASKIFGGNDIHFILTSNEEFSRIRNFKTQKGLALDFYKLNNMEELPVAALPTTFIFDRDGKMVFSETGQRQWDSPESIEMLRNIVNNHE